MWQAYAGVKARPRSAQVVVVVHRLGLEGCDVGAYAGSVLSMAKAAAAEVDAGGRAVRVSSPDRIIFEATRDTAEVTKLMVAESIGRAHVCTPVTNAHIVCRLLLEKNK